MTLLDILKPEAIAEMKKHWPAGINFKNKTRFLGYTHDGVGGVSDVTLSIEMLDSNEWAATFRPMDKETIKAIGGLFESLGGRHPSVDEIHEKGFDHPCRETCSGWRQGYERGLFEARREISQLKDICKRFDSASKSKRTKSVTHFFGRHFK